MFGTAVRWRHATNESSRHQRDDVTLSNLPASHLFGSQQLHASTKEIKQPCSICLHLISLVRWVSVVSADGVRWSDVRAEKGPGFGKAPPSWRASTASPARTKDSAFLHGLAVGGFANNISFKADSHINAYDTAFP